MSDISKIDRNFAVETSLNIERIRFYDIPSITQGGCASRPGNSYESIISRALQTDYLNLGFSGNAKAEDEMAQYIKDLDMSIFVYDYDHNAPTVEHLEKTHQRMFLTIRQSNPDLPIPILSRPKYSLSETDRMAAVQSFGRSVKADAVCDRFSGRNHYLYLTMPAAYAADLYLLLCGRR